jgi:2-polyprenyl-6-methoxyphenol hydroxylase-like FAD-dependent oxidoreductase
VVVGGGPCGASLALLLGRAGWTVTLVEAMAHGTPRPYRGEGLMPSGVAALEAMGLWPLPSAVRHRPLDGWAVVLERQPFFTVAEPLAGDRGCWLVDQEALLAHLRTQLEKLSGAWVVEGVAVRDLLWAAAGGDVRQLFGAEGGEGPPGTRGDGPRGRVTGVVLADGTELAADLVVACEGRSSSLRRLAGLTLQGEGAGPWPRRGERGREQVLWFRLAGPEVAPLERWLAGRFLTVVGAGLSFALFAEAGGEALRLGWVAEPWVAPPADRSGWLACWAAALPEEGAALMRQLPVAAIEGPERLPVRVGWAPRWHSPGLLLLGDAAHPMSPVRAQGINMALRDALVAAQLLGPLAPPTPPELVKGEDPLAPRGNSPADPPSADPPPGGRPPSQAASTIGVPVAGGGSVASTDPGVSPGIAPTATDAPGDTPAETGPGAQREAEGAGVAHARIDALLPRIAARRLPEIRRLQVLQAREAGLGARLRQQGWLRRGLAATAPWTGPLARRRWIQQQHRLRQGLPGALTLAE